MTAQVSERLDVADRLLDRQIVDRNGRPFAKVDDLELEVDSEGRPYVVALLCGPGALGPRLGRRLGRWVVAIWKRQHPAVHPAPVRIPMSAVASVDNAVNLSLPRDSTAAGAVEDWVAEHFISRIPGASHGE
jgi:sporulation protein YlmC with PRC-barrel domain